MSEPQPHETPVYRHLNDELAKLGGLDDYVISRRLEGLSWAKISRNLWRLTDVSVSDETLRKWFSQQTGDNHVTPETVGPGATGNNG